MVRTAVSWLTYDTATWERRAAQEDKAHFTVYCHGQSMHCGDVCEECGFTASTSDLLRAHGLTSTYPKNIEMIKEHLHDMDRAD